MNNNLIVKAGFGFLSGIGLDEGMRQIAIRYPDLQKPSPLPIPGYDPAGIHYDDLLVLIGSLGLAGYGAIKKDPAWVATGIMMALGSYVASVLFTPAVTPIPTTAALIERGVYID